MYNVCLRTDSLINNAKINSLKLIVYNSNLIFEALCQVL